MSPGGARERGELWADISAWDTWGDAPRWGHHSDTYVLGCDPPMPSFPVSEGGLVPLPHEPQPPDRSTSQRHDQPGYSLSSSLVSSHTWTLAAPKGSTVSGFETRNLASVGAPRCRVATKTTPTGRNTTAGRPPNSSRRYLRADCSASSARQCSLSDPTKGVRIELIG